MAAAAGSPPEGMHGMDVVTGDGLSPHDVAALVSGATCSSAACSCVHVCVLRGLCALCDVHAVSSVFGGASVACVTCGSCPHARLLSRQSHAGPCITLPRVYWCVDCSLRQGVFSIKVPT